MAIKTDFIRKDSSQSSMVWIIFHSKCLNLRIDSCVASQISEGWCQFVIAVTGDAVGTCI